MKKRTSRIIILIIVLAMVTATLLLTILHKKESIVTPPLTKEQKKEIRETKISVSRYEQELFSLDVNHLPEEVAKCYGKYPENLISNECWENSQMMDGLKAYLTDPTIKALYQEVEKQYPNVDDIINELQKAFKVLRSHFPDAIVPNVYTLLPGMDFEMPSVFIYDNNLFICLDMYLGSNFKYYKMAGMPKYISERCQRKYIATDCFTKGIVYKYLPENTLLTGIDNMIYEGKKLFFTQTMFPDKSEQELIHYSDEKYAWTKKNEKNIWHYFVDKNMLFTKDDDVIRRLVEESPFTRDFGNNSPGRLGAFIGWQIVKEYMKNHPKTTLDELMKLTDSQKILKESLYKP